MIIANFKSNIVDSQNWIDNFMNSCQQVKCYVGIAPPYIHLSNYLEGIQCLDNQNNLDNDDWNIEIGAQDVDHSSGSRTGAISVEMLEDFGVDFVIIGHSERREFFHEENDLIRKKIHIVNESKLNTTILCIGETKEENEEGLTKDTLKNQLEVVNGLELGENFTVAYEPVWAIGSGLTPEPKDINEIHKYIKDVVQSVSTNNLVPAVVYGGSVTDKNAENFFKGEFVDGALVGGASLNGMTFANIVNIWGKSII